MLSLSRIVVLLGMSVASCLTLAAYFHLSANMFLDALGNGDFLNAMTTYGNYANLIYYKVCITYVIGSLSLSLCLLINFSQRSRQPWSRSGPYLIGCLTGFYLDWNKDRVKIPVLGLYFGYVLSAIVFLFLLFITYTEVNYGWNRIEDTLNIGFSRDAWVGGTWAICA